MIAKPSLTRFQSDNQSDAVIPQHIFASEAYAVCKTEYVPMTANKILLVDDQPRTLEVFRLSVENDFDIELVDSAAKAWQLLNSTSDFAVVISDMHMPVVDGVQFLTTVRNRFPTITRIIMTADSDQEIAAKAVNDGQVFRFLQKPFSTAELRNVLQSGLEHHAQSASEKNLLEETLRGSINLLVDLLADVKPLAFGRSRRAKKLVSMVCRKLEIEHSWEIKVSAMLSQIGCISVPDRILEAIHSGETLKAVDQMEFNQHAKFGESLIEKIPQMKSISRLVGWQHKRFDELRVLASSERELISASILAACLEFDRLVQMNTTAEDAIDEMRQDRKRFDIKVVDALATVVLGTKTTAQLTAWDLRVGMTLDSDVIDTRGSLLVPRGQVITEIMLKRLQCRAASIKDPITVVLSTVDSMMESETDMPTEQPVG
ncbi:HD domain-containing phosphohydrolase [Rhodopirellula baltica]|uniref:Response regulator receiver protein n=1 Tax=Rhodopirellula baltica WH47 TaxID=991778 RepID=F2AQ75_RHOBT|nr:HD domain-containing phosphohydrolase [Rhodopirellula baltica]EGF28181.1 response regulator receiver protein [Rhodopirellula baltica WH47]